MKNENKFILELCKFNVDNKEILSVFMDKGLDYPYVLGHLLYNRIGGIAYYTLKKQNLLSGVNREFRNTLKTVFETNVNKSNSLISALSHIKSACDTLKCEYALLKGAYLVDLYPRGLRTSNDIDFLVEPESITELSERLKEAEFKQGNIRNDEFVPADRREIIMSRMNRGETVPFVKELNLPNMKFLELDINFSLGFKPGMDEAVVTKFLSCTEPIINGNLKTLNRVDFLLHLCAHLYKEATVINWVEMGRDISLYKYCDIYLFISNFFDDTYSTEFCKQAIDLQLRKETYYALYYTKVLFDIDNPALDKVLNEIKPKTTEFMTEIIRPSDDKKYYFKHDYIDWVFCSNRKENLYET